MRSIRSLLEITFETQFEIDIWLWNPDETEPETHLLGSVWDKFACVKWNLRQISVFEINLDLRQKLSHKLAVKYIGSNHDLTLLNDPDALGQTLTTFRRSDQSTATFKITVTIVIVMTCFHSFHAWLRESQPKSMKHQRNELPQPYKNAKYWWLSGMTRFMFRRRTRIRRKMRYLKGTWFAGPAHLLIV